MKFIFSLLFLYMIFSLSLLYGQPEALYKSITTQFNTPIDIALEGTDEDNAGKQLVFSIVNEPINGQLGEINQETDIVTYTPNEDFIGQDTFKYKVNDGIFDSEPIQVTISIQAPPNHPPTAQARDFIILFNSPIDITLEAIDENPADDTLQFSIVNEPQNGQLGEIYQETGTVTYTPNEGFTGSDTFTYIVNNGTVGPRFATVTINVESSPITDNSKSSEKFHTISSYMVNELKQLNATEVKNYPFLELENKDIRELLILLDKGNLTKVLFNIPDDVLKEINNRLTPEIFDTIISKLNQAIIDNIHERLI